MKDRTDNSNLKCTSPIETEVRLDAITIRENFKTGLDQTTNTEDEQDMDKTIEVGQGMILIIEIAMGIIQEVMKIMGGQTISITGEENLKSKL